LFKIERALATAPRKKRESVRQAKSRPIVDGFFLWCDQQAARAVKGRASGSGSGRASGSGVAGSAS
ncbi:hypothetical protein, partial [Nannocystis pusilla]|uniref:hypothetical protein n=1 Tax=Nannocystis pusilla TaxID=889268 RepID=UPI003BEF58A7